MFPLHVCVYVCVRLPFSFLPGTGQQGSQKRARECTLGALDLESSLPPPTYTMFSIVIVIPHLRSSKCVYLMSHNVLRP